MLDARNVYRKVTRKIYDFSPEQLANLTSIIWLYRGQIERFVALVADHLANAIKASEAAKVPIGAFTEVLEKAYEMIAPLFKGRRSEAFQEFDALVTRLQKDADEFTKATTTEAAAWGKAKRDNEALKVSAKRIAAR